MSDTESEWLIIWGDGGESYVIVHRRKNFKWFLKDEQNLHQWRRKGVGHSSAEKNEIKPRVLIRNSMRREHREMAGPCDRLDQWNKVRPSERILIAGQGVHVFLTGDWYNHSLWKWL